MGRTWKRKGCRFVRNCCALIFFALPLYTSAEVTQIDTVQLEQFIANGQTIIDVRLPEEWMQTGVVPGSHLLTFFDANGKYDLDRWLDDLQAIAGESEHVALICAVGTRSDGISRVLHSKLGYRHVYNVTAGIEEWIRSGRETVPPPMVYRY